MNPAVSLNPSMLCTVTCNTPSKAPRGMPLLNFKSTLPARFPLLLTSTTRGLSRSSSSCRSSALTFKTFLPMQSSERVSESKTCTSNMQSTTRLFQKDNTSSKVTSLPPALARHAVRTIFPPSARTTYGSVRSRNPARSLKS